MATLALASKKEPTMLVGLGSHSQSNLDHSKEVTRMTSIVSDGELPRLLTTAQATDYLWSKVSRSASARLYRAAADERITSKRLSGRHWWPLSDLQKLVGEI
jgi:hypothetical protein